MDGISEGLRALRHYLIADAGRLAVVSSFGADSAVLLSLVADVEPATPVLFLDTGKHFDETLAYRRELARHLGLRDVRDIGPAPDALTMRDPTGHLHVSEPDACCGVRKVAPLTQALAPFAVWVTGRRRAQAATRASMKVVEHVDGRVKVNPLAHWEESHVADEFTRRRLPRHPLFHSGFTSIGCAPCTRPQEAGGDPRGGRWHGHVKTECGIHRAGMHGGGERIL